MFVEDWAFIFVLYVFLFPGHRMSSYWEPLSFRSLLYYLIFKASCTFYSILRYYRRALLTVQVPARLRVRPPLSGAEGYSTVIYSHVSGHVPTPIKLCLDTSNSLIFTQNRCFYITVRESLISADHILLVPFLWESDCILP